MRKRFGQVGRLGVAAPFVLRPSAEAKTLLDSFTGRPTATRARAIDRFMKGMSAKSLLADFALLYFTAAHDTQASQLNWIAPSTFALSDVGGLTRTVDQGVAGNGSTGYCNTAWDPSTNGGSLVVQNSACIHLYSRTTAASGSATFGNGTSTGAFLVSPRQTGDTTNYRVNQGTTAAIANTDGRGLYSGERSGANATQLYKNGAASGAAGSVASAAPTSIDLNIGRVASGFSTVEFSMAAVSAALGATKQADFYTLVQEYLTELGAAV